MKEAIEDFIEMMENSNDITLGNDEGNYWFESIRETDEFHTLKASIEGSETYVNSDGTRATPPPFERVPEDKSSRTIKSSSTTGKASREAVKEAVTAVKGEPDTEGCNCGVYVNMNENSGDVMCPDCYRPIPVEELKKPEKQTFVQYLTEIVGEDRLDDDFDITWVIFRLSEYLELKESE